MASVHANVLRHLHQLATQHVSDNELLRRFAQRRDEAAFTALVRRHGPMVYHVCRRTLGNTHDAEDACQATFQVLAARAGAGNWQSSLAGWLHEAARRIALKSRTATMRRQKREGRDAVVARSGDRATAREERKVEMPLDDITARELQEALDAELARLPEKYRAPLVLCYLEGATRDEAARQLGWPASTLKLRVERGRELLRQRLVKRGLSLSTALGAVALTADPAPAALLQATARAALQTGVPSPHVLALVHDGLQVLPLSRLKIAAALLLAASLAVGVQSELTSPTRQQGNEPVGLEDSTHPTKTTRTEKADLHGDPLPSGALVRVGTIRFRHAEGVRCSVFSPDGKTLITGGHDGLLRLWDVATGKELRRFVGHRGSTYPIALSPNGALLASWGSTGSNGEGVRVWEVATAKELRRLEGPKEGHLLCLAWSPDNKTLAAGGDNGVVRVWDAIAGQELQNNAWHKGPVGSVAFSPDGTKLASAGGHKDGTIRLRDLAGGQEPLVLRAALGDGREKEVHFVAFSRDGKTLISGGDCYGDEISIKNKSINTIAVWDAAIGKRLRQFRVGDDQEKPHRGAVSVVLSADGKTLALGYWDHTVRLWDLESGKPLRTLTGYPDRFYPAYHLAFSPDGKALAACGSNHAVCLLDTATGKQLFDDGLAHKSNIRSVALSPDGKILATASHDYTICLWDAVTGKPLHQLRGHESWVYTVTFAPDGRTVASGSSDGTVRLWNVATGKEVRKLAAEEEENPGGLGKSYVARLAFSPDGKVLASSHDLGDKAAMLKLAIRLWDPSTGKELRRLNAPSLLHGGDLSFSADGESLLAVGDDKTIHRWRVATGKEVHAHAVHGHRWLTVSALSPDGRLAATGDPDGLVQIWDTATGRLLLAIHCEKETGYRLVFSPDGRYLALCGASYNRPDKTEKLAIELWELASGKMVRKQPLPPHTGVSAAVFAADGRRLAAGMGDTTAVIWNLGPAAGAGLQTTPPRRLEDHWATLAGDDAAKAYQALGALIDSPGAAAFLKEHLKPAAEVDPKPIQRWIVDLDSDEFVVREKASRELQKYGPEAGPVLRQVLSGEPSAEVRRRLQALLERPPLPISSADMLRRIRAVTILERIASPEARTVLEDLAKGAPGASQTREANAALERLRRQASRP